LTIVEKAEPAGGSDCRSEKLQTELLHEEGKVGLLKKGSKVYGRTAKGVALRMERQRGVEAGVGGAKSAGIELRKTS
jgi:hypothetical protein